MRTFGKDVKMLAKTCGVNTGQVYTHLRHVKYTIKKDPNSEGADLLYVLEGPYIKRKPKEVEETKV